jgi:hypothetical protein
VTDLAERARAAYAATLTEPESYRTNARWARLAWTSRRTLAEILGSGPEKIELTVSTLRRYGGWPWPELTVTGPHDSTCYRFTAAYNDPDRLMILGPCPACSRETPTANLGDLADLGRILTGDRPPNYAPATDPNLPPEFFQDPGHQPTCCYAQH